MKITKVGVVGCGLMGSGIAQVTAQADFDTTVVEASDEALRAGLDRIDAFLAKGIERGKVTVQQKAQTLGRIKGTTDLASLGDRDLVIEAVSENLDLKRRTFARLDEVLRPDALLASNTSSLSITEMAAATRHPERFVGLHFFNPVPLMKLVEVIHTARTRPGAADAIVEFARRLDKTPIRTSDRTGFIVNRLLVPYQLDAVRALEEGVASIADIDNGMKLGCGHPMGPLTLNDFVGIDTLLHIAHIMFDEFHERRFAPPPLVKRMVMSGFLGRKSGRGFYDYSLNPPHPNDFLVAR
ncbi:MAG TPA: 3-hydroxybutyryl-CoA dehydrogenase [Candidatus Polarisedimenticolia bacterium]|nr:3-hydroxybutyryl-CoA dehydrogenase [Candidatus Polarisedimenticolia bacterium]